MTQPAGRRMLAFLHRAVLGAALAAGALLGLAAYTAAIPRENRAPRRERLASAELPLRQACRAAGVAYPPRRPALVIRKGEQVLQLYAGTILVKEYRTALGFSPAGDKERQGDGRTPTGDFYVCTRNGASRFHRFLGLSYPAPDDARRGLRAGLISHREHRAILQAHAQRRQPSWNTALGGAVGIHGGGTAANWTLGCIALENERVAELFPILSLGTPVRIVE